MGLPQESAFIPAAMGLRNACNQVAALDINESNDITFCFEFVIPTFARWPQHQPHFPFHPKC